MELSAVRIVMVTLPYLKRDHLHKGSKRVRGCRADVVIWVAHAP